MPYLIALSAIYEVFFMISSNEPVDEILIVIVFAVIINYYVWRRFKNIFQRVDYDKMSGNEFEDFCVTLLKSNGFYNVSKTKSSGDHGVDILASKSGRIYAIQCKRYSKNVGNKAVQEAYSGKDIYGANVSVVMTNQRFTKQAINDAKKLGVQLWDRSVVDSMKCSKRKNNNRMDSYVECEREEINQHGRIKKYPESYIDSYAKECCAVMEHEDEMKSYMEHFNIND